MALPVFTVSQLTRYIKNLFERDAALTGLWVRGEISNCKLHTNGHLYFTLKDTNSSLKCVMFKSRNWTLKFVPENGLQVLAGGNVSVYERDGQYQLYVEYLQPDGIGGLSLAFAQLKEKLAAEGLFDPKHKQRLPLLPCTVGVITSPTGAAVRDIITIIRRRFPGVRLVLCPVAVQGEEAPPQIVQALRLCNCRDDIDVLIVGRGGGSLEELWAFNDERVARAIFASRIPVISAVGHETDYTLADFVADCRAPTPSAAAEMAVPDRQELFRYLEALHMRLKQALRRHISHKRLRLGQLAGSPGLRRPQTLLWQRRQRLDNLMTRLVQAFNGQREIRARRLALVGERLAALNPLAVLSRGYCVARSLPGGQVVKSVGQVTVGAQLELIFADGRACCTAESIREENEIHDGV